MIKRPKKLENIDVFKDCSGYTENEMAMARNYLGYGKPECKGNAYWSYFYAYEKQGEAGAKSHSGAKLMSQGVQNAITEIKKQWIMEKEIAIHNGEDVATANEVMKKLTAMMRNERFPNGEKMFSEQTERFATSELANILGLTNKKEAADSNMITQVQLNISSSNITDKQKEIIEAKFNERGMLIDETK